MKRSLASAALALIAAAAPPMTVIPLPDGERGIGFDDLRFSPTLGRILVPAGRTGRLNLIDPATRAVETIDGFSSQATFEGGHGAGPTSVDDGASWLFVTDRSLGLLDIVDPRTKRVVASAPLAGGPDYVRWVAPLSEVWVTEPRRESIECFKLEHGDPPRLRPVSRIDVPDGPESLAIDPTRSRAYTHTWHDATVVIDLVTHKPLGLWQNGCKGARGIALDERRGLLFVGCAEGKATALDVAHGGGRVGSAKTAKGVDIIAYSLELGHLYVPGGSSAAMTIISVESGGELRILGSVPTAPDAHCVTVDDRGNAYVCDPAKGRLLVFADSSRTDTSGPRR